MSVPPKDILNYLNPAMGGFSSVKNPGNVGPRGIRSWSNFLASQQPEFRDPAEVEAYNAQLQNPSMMGVAPQYPVPAQIQGLNVPEAPEQVPSQDLPQGLPQQGVSPQQDPYSFVDEGLLNAARFEKSAAQNTYNAARKIAQEEQAALKGRIDAAEAFAANTQKINEEKDARIADEMTKLDELGKKAADGKVTPFWAKASTEQKIGAGLAMALGAFGSSFSKGPNYAMQIIDKAIDDDVRSQMANIDQNNKAFANQREYVGEIKSMYRDRLEQAAALKSMAYDKVENQLLSIASRNKELMALPQFQSQLAKIQESKIASQMGLAKARAETMKIEAEARSGGDRGKINESQWKAAAFANRGINSLGVMTDLLQKGYDPTTTAGRAADSLPKELQSTARQQFDQASEDIIAAILRKESGAAIGKDEKASAIQQYIPLPGDSPAVRDQKLARIRDNLSVYVAEAGPALQMVRQQQGSASQEIPSAPSAVAQHQEAFNAAVKALQKDPSNTRAREVFERSKKALGL